VFALHWKNKLAHLQLAGMIKKEGDWIIESCQLSSGAIVTPYPRGKMIIPYSANLAALGLAGDSAYSGPLFKYLTWYLAHLEKPDRWGVHGTVYDYSFSADGQEISTRNYDSADSYGATFLTLVRAYYEISKDKDFLFSCKKNLESISEGIMSLQDRDGLTWAKPGHKIKYLMDNCEVFRGLSDLAFLEGEVYRNTDCAELLQKKAGAVRKGIQERLRRGELYLCAAGKRILPFQKSKLGKWYPDAVAQLYPAWTGVIDPGSAGAKKIYEKFNEAQPGWPELEKADHFPWCVVAYVAALMGDEKRVFTYLEKITVKYLKTGHPWPWHPMESGFLMLTLNSINNF
jgi:hypothetical protein